MLARLNKYFYQKFLVLVLSGFFLTGCQIASPINTTKEFLSLLQTGQIDQASQLIVKSVPVKQTYQLKKLNQDEKTTWEKNTQESLGKISKFSVQNAVPINENELKKYGVNEGYEVFFAITSDKGGAKNMKGYLFKIDNSWKILKPIF